MSKRFIDTNLFSDEWFCDLSKDCKLFFIYFITQCDHAGVLRLNKKLCKFQTGINDIDTVIKEFANCIITVKEGLYFLPKYLKFQYPNFPQSDVRQQDGAIKILKELNLWDENNNTYLRVNKELPNSYVNDTVIVHEPEIVKNKLCLFKNSEYSDFEKFKQADKWNEKFPNVNIQYYFDSFMDWSNSKDIKKTDWIATVRNGMRGDKAKNKLVINKNDSQIPRNEVTSL